MNDPYDYVSVRLRPGGLGSFRSGVAPGAVAALAADGGVLVAGWLGAGSIGWPDDRVLALVGWPGGAGEWTGATRWLGATPGAAGVEVTRLRATVRPDRPTRAASGGVHAHRWFDFDPADTDEVIELSAQAWPAFESSFEARIEGLFAVEGRPGRLLLVTWYSSVAEWERSRGVARAETGDLEAARAGFERRRQLTRRQVVRLAAPAF